MSLKSTATTIAVVASLAVGGHAAALTRGESPSDRARPSQEQRPRPDVLVTRYRVEAPTADIEVRHARSAQADRVEWAAAAYASVVVKGFLSAVEAAKPKPRQQVGRVRSRQLGPDSGRHYSCPQFASGDNPAGDFAVPCYIIDRESDGGYAADNPTSSAYGAYQIMHLPPGTPPAEQDRIARGMALCNWEPPHYCAG